MFPNEFFLKFTDRPTAITALASAGIDTSNNTIPSDGWVGPIYFNLDVIFGTGQIWKPSATLVDGNGNPVMELKAGFHINMLWREDTLPTALQSFEIVPEPDTPVVTFG